jgi:replicative DNA helicase
MEAVTLDQALQPHAAKIGKPADIVADCAAAVPSPALAAEHYAPIVRGQAILRRLAEYGAQLNHDICAGPDRWSPDYVQELVATAEYDLEQIISRRMAPREKGWREVLGEEIWRLEHQEGQGIPTGFATLDRCYGGFGPGELTFLTARTSRGKTQFAMNLAINAAKCEPPFPTVFFTLEMTLARLVLRTLSCASVDLFRARQCGYRPGEKNKIQQAADNIMKLPLELLYRPSMRPRELRLECRRLAREVGLKFAVVDYGGLMRGNQREKQRWEEMRELIMALKDIAGELNIPILVLWQLNREVGDHEEPVLANLRDTGAGEEHATDVLMLGSPGRSGKASHM